MAEQPLDKSPEENRAASGSNIEVGKIGVGGDLGKPAPLTLLVENVAASEGLVQARKIQGYN